MDCITFGYRLVDRTFPTPPLARYVLAAYDLAVAQCLGKCARSSCNMGSSLLRFTSTTGLRSKGSVSNVEMVAPMALTYKVLFPSISTIETLLDRSCAEDTATATEILCLALHLHLGLA